MLLTGLTSPLIKVRLYCTLGEVLKSSVEAQASRFAAIWDYSARAERVLRPSVSIYQIYSASTCSSSNTRRLIVASKPTPIFAARLLSSFGTHRNGLLWDISGRKTTQFESEGLEDEQQELVSTPTTQSQANLEEEIDEMLIEASRLLQAGSVEEAEHLVLEGMRTAETSLRGSNSLLVELSDQVALLQFFQGRFKSAERHARRSLAAAELLDDGSSAVAMCKLRLGAILLGLERHSEGAKVLEEAHSALSAEFGSEFTPVNEAMYYLTLARLPMSVTGEAIQALEEQLLLGLQGMSDSPGVGPHLLRAALREHRALMDRAVEAKNWSLAEAILQQAVRLQESVCPKSEEMALSTYQYATLQYIWGRLSKAEELCLASLELSRQLYKRDSDNQVALRLHRLGTLYLARGETSKAVEMLSKSCKSLISNVGNANPLTGESRAALSLARLSQLDESHGRADPYTRILNPGRRKELIAEAGDGLAVMEKGFGAQHMLVEKMRQLYNRIAL